MTPTTFNRRSSTTGSKRVSDRSANSARCLVKTIGKVCVVVGLACVLPHPTPVTAAVPGLSFTQTGCDGYSDSVARLYTAAFGRTPEQSGFQYWMTEYTAGRWPLPRMADHFTQSTEFNTRYGALDNNQFINQIYRNVLGREADTSGLTHWNNQMTAGMTRGTLLLRFAESPENITRTGTSQPLLGAYNEGRSGPWDCTSLITFVVHESSSRAYWAAIQSDPDSGPAVDALQRELSEGPPAGDHVMTVSFSEIELVGDITLEGVIQVSSASGDLRARFGFTAWQIPSDRSVDAMDVFWGVVEYNGPWTIDVLDFRRI